MMAALDANTAGHPPEDDWFDKMVDANSVLREARDYGIDLHMLWDNYLRPVEERIRRHQAALKLYRKLQIAGRNK